MDVGSGRVDSGSLDTAPTAEGHDPFSLTPPRSNRTAPPHLRADTNEPIVEGIPRTVHVEVERSVEDVFREADADEPKDELPDGCCYRFAMRRACCGLLGGVTGCGCFRVRYLPSWEGHDGDEVADLRFVLYTLRRKSKEFGRYRDLLVYIVFLSIFTQTLLAGKGLGDGFWTVNAMAGATADGEFDQGPATELYFQKTFRDIGQPSEWFQFMTSQQTMVGLIGQDYQSPVGQNHILPIIRLRQHRVAPQKEDACGDADEFLRGNWTGWISCHHDWDDGMRLTEIPRKSGGPVDVCGTDRMGRSPFEFSRVSQVWPGHDSDRVSVQGRHNEYHVHGYFVDFYADMNVSVYLSVIECLRREHWVDQAATRALEVQFHTYNPATNIFLEMRLLTELSASGLMNTVVRPRVFVMFDPMGYSFVLEVLLLCGILWYVFRLAYEIYENISRTGRAFLWAFSVWRLVEIFNLTVFIWVSVYKFEYYLMPKLELKYHPVLSHDSIRTHPSMMSKGQPFYDDAVFARLEDYAFTMHRLVMFSALNGCLSFLKLFKYFSLSAYFNLLTETIKESIASLLALGAYLFIITNAFACMGLVIFGTQLEEWSTYEHCLRSLFISILGDFNYDAMLEVNRQYVDMFFFGYQILTWLLLINMVISIISTGFQLAQERQNKAVGEVPLAFALRELWVWVEDKVGECMCCEKAKNKKNSEKALPSIMNWNHVAGISIGDIFGALNGARTQDGWLELHMQEGIGVEVRRVSDESEWCVRQDCDNEGQWGSISWEARCTSPSVRLSCGRVVTYPTATHSALVRGLQRYWSSNRNCCPRQNDEQNDEHRAKAEEVADALCWYFDPLQLIRPTLYRSWVFYNEVEIPRQEYGQTDERGAKPWQIRYLQEIEGENDAFTPLVGSVRDEMSVHEKSLSLTGRALGPEPKTEGSDSRLLRDPTTTAKLEKLLTMLQEQDAVLSGLVEREKKRERDLEPSKTEVTEEPFQSEDGLDSSGESGYGPVTYSPEYHPSAPVPTPPVLVPSPAPASVPAAVAPDGPQGVVADFVDTSDSETAQSIQLQYT